MIRYIINPWTLCQGITADGQDVDKRWGAGLL